LGEGGFGFYPKNDLEDLELCWVRALEGIFGNLMAAYGKSFIGYPHGQAQQQIKYKEPEFFPGLAKQCVITC
jgi:hypothetical protein